MSGEANGVPIVHRSARNTEVVPARGRGERRRAPRVTLDLDGQVVVRLGGAEWPAVLNDVSSAGVGLSVAGAEANLCPEAGQEIEMVVQVHGEGVPRRGRVAWATHSGGVLRCGLGFVGLPEDADCVGLLNVAKIRIDPSWALRIPPHLAFRRQVLPFAFADDCVHVAAPTPRMAPPSRPSRSWLATPSTPSRPSRWRCTRAGPHLRRPPGSGRSSDTQPVGGRAAAE